MSNDVGIKSIGQIAIAVTDIYRSTAFYQDTLGLKLLFEVPTGLAFFDCGGVRLMLTTLQGERADHNTSVIYYKVDDIHQATKALKEKGVTFIREPQLAAKMDGYELWNGFLRDPDENLVAITADVPI
ncbi:MAG: glyoxalase [Gammaproteobacteria bacterium]|nr:MAG: glyoxalase [Gammaproteobacteria bacterium]